MSDTGNGNVIRYGSSNDGKLNDGELNKIKLKALKFSQQFFSKKYTARLINNGSIDVNAVNGNIEQLLKIYSDVTTCYSYSETKYEKSDLTINEFFDGIIKKLTSVDRRELLKITSTKGSGKDLLLQYLYLKIYAESGLVPIYLSFTHYLDVEGDVCKALDNDIDTIMAICNGNENCVLILDGINTYHSVENYLFGCIKDELDVIKAKLILGINWDFSDNSDNKREENSFIAENRIISGYPAQYWLNFAQMRLDRGEETKRFIKNCLEFENKTTQLNKLTAICFEPDMQLTKIDLLMVRQIVGVLETGTQLETISDLYNAIITALLNVEKFGNAMEFAFRYEVEGSVRSYESFNDRKIIKTIFSHRNVLDYFIARYYVDKLDSIDLSSNMTQDTIQNISEFINVVFTKKTNRFVVSMMHNTDNCEKNLLNLSNHIVFNRTFTVSNEKAKKEEKPMLDVFGKSEIVFLLGRLSTENQADAIVALKSLVNNQRVQYFKNKKNYDDERKKCESFILRCIYVSLIHYNDEEETKNFLQLLLYEKIFNEINKGFHMEYYDDIPLKLRSSFSSSSGIGLDDNKVKGENTLRAITINLEREKDSSACVFTYDLMTYCTLILARKPSKDFDNSMTFNTGKYRERCLEFIDLFFNKGLDKKFGKLISHFFSWVRDELNQHDYEYYTETKMYNKFCMSQYVRRTGWLQRRTAEDIGDWREAKFENITEHMYNSWLMGLLFLPETKNEIKCLTDPYNKWDAASFNTYNKQTILSILLIHDLPETVTGDIPRDKKWSTRENANNADNEEDLIMHKFLLMSSYPFVNASISDYLSYWEQWQETFDKKNINAKIAKDIDNIQAVYQYCLYVNGEVLEDGKLPPKIIVEDQVYADLDVKPAIELQNHKKNSLNDFYQWIGEVDEDNENSSGYVITTKMGKLLSKKIIFENPLLVHVIEKYRQLKKQIH